MGAFVASFAPDAFVQGGGGLVDDFDGTITTAQFTEENPPGYLEKAMSNNPTFKAPLCFKIEITHKDGEGADTVTPIWYSLGGTSLDMFMPSESGYTLMENPDYTGTHQMIKGSKFNLFIDGLVAAGYPTSKLTTTDANPEPLRALVGLHAHWLRKADPVRAGLSHTRTDNKGNQRDITTLLPVKLITIPGDTQAAAGVTRRRGAAPAAAPAAAAPTTTSPASAPAPAARRGAAPAPAPAAAAPPATQSGDEDENIVAAFFAKLADDPAQEAGWATKKLVLPYSGIKTPAGRALALTIKSNPDKLADLGFYIDEESKLMLRIPE